VAGERVAGDDRARSVGISSLVALAFAALLAALRIGLPPSLTQRHAADPLVQLLGRGDTWIVVAAAVVAAAVWGRRASVRPKDLGWAVAGMATAALVALAIRAVAGSHLPSFVPPEESARPGIVLGLSAGLFEEVVFRLALLPLLVSALTRSMSPGRAAVVAAVATGVLFSLSHEIGPAGGVFDPRLMLTRFLVPGLGMSLVALRVNLTFLVSAHCAAHLVIPALFPG